MKTYLLLFLTLVPLLHADGANPFEQAHALIAEGHDQIEEEGHQKLLTQYDPEVKEQHEALNTLHDRHKQACYAVNLGFPVTYSSVYPGWQFKVFRLNAPNYCWAALQSNQAQWIQVSSSEQKKFTGVITQGRQNANQWVTSYQVVYSYNGIKWYKVDGGRLFTGNSDRNTQVRHMFRRPVWARTIRIVPHSWHAHISLRFDFLFKCDQ